MLQILRKILEERRTQVLYVLYELPIIDIAHRVYLIDYGIIHIISPIDKQS